MVPTTQGNIIVGDATFAWATDTLYSSSNLSFSTGSLLTLQSFNGMVTLNMPVDGVFNAQTGK